MRLHLESQLNKEFLRLSYIVRPTARPDTFHTLTHELESVIENDGSTATSVRDSKLVYSTLYSNTSDTTAKSYMEQDNEIQCDRTAWFSVEALYEGSGNNERLIRDIQQKLNYQAYSGNGQGQALPLTKWLFDFYKELAERGSLVQEIDKLRHLRRIMRFNMDTAPWYVNW